MACPFLESSCLFTIAIAGYKYALTFDAVQSAGPSPLPPSMTICAPVM
jgi:hypothetical protein